MSVDKIYEVNGTIEFRGWDVEYEAYIRPWGNVGTWEDPEGMDDVETNAWEGLVARTGASVLDEMCMADAIRQVEYDESA